jgi:hypothetical protein
MPFTNFDSRHFTEADKTAVGTALTALETSLLNKTANLDAAERKQYGSVNEQNKLIINKVKDYYETQPGLSSPDIDWAEFSDDFDTRSFIQSVILRLQSLADGLESAKMLHDWDNYQAALLDYDFSKYKAGTQVPGFKIKVSEIGQFFTGGNPGTAPITENA